MFDARNEKVVVVYVDVLTRIYEPLMQADKATHFTFEDNPLGRS